MPDTDLDEAERYARTAVANNLHRMPPEFLARVMAEYDRRGTELVEAQRAKVTWSKSLRRQEIRVAALSRMLRGMARRVGDLRKGGAKAARRAEDIDGHRMTLLDERDTLQAQLVDVDRLRRNHDALADAYIATREALDHTRARVAAVRALADDTAEEEQRASTANDTAWAYGMSARIRAVLDGADSATDTPRQDDYCRCGHGRTEHDESGVCRGIIRPSFAPDDECFCGRYVAREDDTLPAGVPELQRCECGRAIPCRHCDTPREDDTPAPAGFCCDQMRHHSTLRCDYHDDVTDCPDVLVTHTRQGEAGLPVRDGGGSFVVIGFCPWCGTDLRDDTPAPAPTPTTLDDVVRRDLRKVLPIVMAAEAGTPAQPLVCSCTPTMRVERRRCEGCIEDDRAAGSVSTTPTQPTWPGTHDEDDSLVADLDRALVSIQRVRTAIDEGGIRCGRGHYTAHDDVIGDPNSPRWKCSHCVRVGVDAQTIVDGMTGVSTTPDPAAVDIVWDHRALAYAVKVLVPGAPALLTHARYWDEPEANAAADRVRAALAGNTTEEPQP